MLSSNSITCNSSTPYCMGSTTPPTTIKGALSQLIRAGPRGKRLVPSPRAAIFWGRTIYPVPFPKIIRKIFSVTKKLKHWVKEVLSVTTCGTDSKNC